MDASSQRNPFRNGTTEFNPPSNGLPNLYLPDEMALVPSIGGNQTSAIVMVEPVRYYNAASTSGLRVSASTGTYAGGPALPYSNVNPEPTSSESFQGLSSNLPVFAWYGGEAGFNSQRGGMVEHSDLSANDGWSELQRVQEPTLTTETPWTSLPSSK